MARNSLTGKWMRRQFSGLALGIGAVVAFLAGGVTVWVANRALGEAPHHRLYDICMFDSRPTEEWTPISKVSDLHSLSMDGHLYLPAYAGLFGFDHKCGFHADLIVEYLQTGGYVTVGGLRVAYAEAIKANHAELKAAIEGITVPNPAAPSAAAD